MSFMLLVGTAMAITAFPVLARLLAERQMLATKIGSLALICAAIDDVIGWCLLALVIAIVNATGVASVAVTIGLLVLFVGVMLAVVRPLLLFADQRIKSKPMLMAVATTMMAPPLLPFLGYRQKDMRENEAMGMGIDPENLKSGRRITTVL